MFQKRFSLNDQNGFIDTEWPTNGTLPGGASSGKDHDPSHETSGSQQVASSKATPEHFRQQYLKRIALGESTSGTDLGDRQAAIASNGVWGIYQFRYTTATEVKRRTGYDAYSDDPNQQANAAWSHIGIYSQEVGVDLHGAIERGDFTKADQALGRDQWTSLPGGSDLSPKWVTSHWAPMGHLAKRLILDLVRLRRELEVSHV
ncbi:MAG: hypothetical protein HC851_24860 [Acaryochloris sp. RU_4_1]|nr:hypothetical protein [Acaryochloris sp. RU_4_1]NJR55490.1 hypothetical protein [Acaryochloris sp. CRU_2_0]